MKAVLREIIPTQRRGRRDGPMREGNRRARAEEASQKERAGRQAKSLLDLVRGKPSGFRDEAEEEPERQLDLSGARSTPSCHAARTDTFECAPCFSATNPQLQCQTEQIRTDVGPAAGAGPESSGRLVPHGQQGLPSCQPEPGLRVLEDKDAGPCG